MCVYGRVGQTHLDFAPRHSLKNFVWRDTALYLSPAESPDQGTPPFKMNFIIPLRGAVESLIGDFCRFMALS